MRLSVLKRLFRLNRVRPVVSISHYGQLTPKPRVTVSLHSVNGAVTLYCFDDDLQGNARAEMLANTVSHISGLPLVMVPR